MSANLTWLAFRGTGALTTEEGGARSRRGRAEETRVDRFRARDVLGMLAHPGSSIFMVWPSKVPLRGEEGRGSAKVEKGTVAAAFNKGVVRSAGAPGKAERA